MYFSEAELESLYDTHAGYVNRVNRRLNELIRDGWYLPEFAPEVRAEAARFDGLG
jgi:Alpha/beta hydrolase domain